MLLEISHDSQENIYARVSLVMKLQAWGLCFPVSFAKFLRTHLLQNTSERLLLNTYSILIFTELSSLLRTMIFNREKLIVTFIKYVPSVASLIFLLKILFWNQLVFPSSTSLSPRELVVNELRKTFSGKHLPICIQLSLRNVKILGTCCKKNRSSSLYYLCYQLSSLLTCIFTNIITYQPVNLYFY